MYVNQINFFGVPKHSVIDGNEMADFLTKVVVRSKEQPRHRIEIKQIETSLFFSGAKSLVRVQLYIAQKKIET